MMTDCRGEKEWQHTALVTELSSPHSHTEDFTVPRLRVLLKYCNLTRKWKNILDVKLKNILIKDVKIVQVYQMNLDLLITYLNHLNYALEVLELRTST